MPFGNRRDDQFDRFMFGRPMGEAQESDQRGPSSTGGTPDGEGEIDYAQLFNVIGDISDSVAKIKPFFSKAYPAIQQFLNKK